MCKPSLKDTEGKQETELLSSSHRNTRWYNCRTGRALAYGVCIEWTGACVSCLPLLCSSWRTESQPPHCSAVLTSQPACSMDPLLLVHWGHGGVGCDSRDPTSSPQSWETSTRLAVPSPQPLKLFLSFLRFTFYFLILSVRRKQMTAGVSRGQRGWNYTVLWVALSSTLQEYCVFLTT